MTTKLSLKTLLTVALMACLALPVLADEKSAPPPEKMKGQDLYKNFCKGCHQPDSVAGEYTPMSLIIEQWEEFFDGVYVETHQEVPFTEGDQRSVTEVINDQMLKKLRKFCVDHAADSEQPMTCG
jgi:hypothetical protein